MDRIKTVPPEAACLQVPTPWLTGDGRAVVTGTTSYSAKDKRLTALWLAYPLTAPDRPRVIGRVVLPAKADVVYPIIWWTDSSGSEVATSRGLLTHNAYIGHGQVRSFKDFLGPGSAAW